MVHLLDSSNFPLKTSTPKLIFVIAVLWSKWTDLKVEMVKILTYYHIDTTLIVKKKLMLSVRKKEINGINN